MEERIKKAINQSPFINSFKIDRRFWHVLLLNFIFIILLLSLIPLYTFIIRSNLDAMKPLDSSAIRIKEMMDGKREPDSLLMEDLELASSALRNFFLKTALTSIIFIATILAVIGYFKAKVWSKITKEKFDRHLILKLSMLVFVWNLFWIILFLLLVFGLKFKLNTIKTIAVIEFFIYIYFSLLIIPIFFKSKKIMKSIKETFLTGAIKFHAFLPTMLTIWVISSILFILIINVSFRFPALSLIILIPLILLYITWIKFYIDAAINKSYHSL